MLQLTERKAAIRDRLSESRQQLVATLESIQPEQQELPTKNAGWAVWDLAVHVASAEGGMEILAQRILAQEPNQAERIASFDVNRFNEGLIRKLRHLDKAGLLNLLATSRQRTLEILEKVSEAELDLRGYHPVGGEVTLEKLFGIIAWHEELHTQDIKEALEAGK